jgi:hypothetical protein
MAATATTATVTRLPLPSYLRLAAAVNGVVAAIIAFVVAALASSRASAHALSPLAMAGLVTGAAATTGVVSWINGLHNGALDRARGVAVLRCAGGDTCRFKPRTDPFTRLWRDALTWGGLAAAWAAAGGGLLAVALNGRHAGLWVIFVAMAALFGLAAVAIDVVARHQGAHVDTIDGAVPLRRRAWREIAVPLALFQMGVNMGVALMLFHDYTPGREAGFHVLTPTVALADVPITVILVGVVFNLLAGGWGTAELRLGRLADPSLNADVAGGNAGVQRMREEAPIGVQAFVYTGLVGVVLAPLFSMLLPAAPSLLATAVVRALFAGSLIFATTGMAFVRGALNGRAELA